jgi:hypothetical protein
VSARLRLFVAVIALVALAAIHIEVPVYAGRSGDYYLCLTYCAR